LENLLDKIKDFTLKSVFESYCFDFNLLTDISPPEKSEQAIQRGIRISPLRRGESGCFTTKYLKKEIKTSYSKGESE
jgi:hypothetical protein